MKPAILGAVSYLNTKPLVRGLEERPDLFSVRFDVPSVCARLLHDGRVDDPHGDRTDCGGVVFQLPDGTCWTHMTQLLQNNAVMHNLAADLGLACNVLDVPQMEAAGMGALLGVASASADNHPPRFIILEHRTAGSDGRPPVVLVGKGITFDSGGLSIKTAEGMLTMKSDMAGGAAVLGALRAAAGLKLPFPVVGLVPATENLIGQRGFRPSDILRASNGKIIEINSTDAEGRLILAKPIRMIKTSSPVLPFWGEPPGSGNINLSLRSKTRSFYPHPSISKGNGPFYPPGRIGFAGKRMEIMKTGVRNPPPLSCREGNYQPISFSGRQSSGPW